ncbi:hypothetical protein ACJ73_09764 [Blastomyces percursus]|uniref:Uncharacterized protein n=1 Tax=Blastomyces percursus TaxID=1658174 RepID=A0A1J9P3U7_9EURO|nr:hypothetical protein ACJ73_09764 [Blastomyces percursus]
MASHRLPKWWHILAYNLMDIGADPLELAPNQTNGADCAIMVGETSIARSMLERGLNAMTHPSVLQDALHWVVRAQSMDAIKLLVEYGGGIDIEDIKWTLEYGADPNAGNGSKGRTALHIATGEDDVLTMRLLMEYGAEVEVADWEGRTSLHASSMLRHLAGMQFLIDNGADINAQDRDHRRSVTHYAALSGDIDIVKVLVASGADVEAQQNGGRRALHHALVQVHEDIVRFLIEVGADRIMALSAFLNSSLSEERIYMPNTKQDGQPFILPLQLERMILWNRLLALGLNINERCLCGGTPLWVATRKGHASTVRLLVSRGADADISGGGEGGADNWTPLFVASRNGNEAIVEILLEHAVNVDAVTHDGYTALAEAVLQGHERVYSFLS